MEEKKEVKKTPTKKTKAVAPKTVITSYKGFDSEWECRGFQYEVGATYEHSGEVTVCESGFHACEYPLDVFNYYPPSTSKFALVEQGGETHKKQDGDSKIASRSISIKAEIGISELVKAAVEFTKSKCLPIDPLSPASAAGDYGAASAAGDYGAASATGNYGAASVTGNYGAASAAGDYGAASATGNYGAASVTGNYGAASVTGNYGAASAVCYRGMASATGVCGAALATGDYGAASATGDYGAASVVGYRGAASATGVCGAALATGDYGAASATGYRGAASATGCRGAASATGNYGAASATGEASVAISTGYSGKAMARDTGAIVLVKRDEQGNIKHIRASKVGDNGIKPDTWYELDVNGQFVECME